MDAPELKKRLCEIFGEKIRFNKDFDINAEKLKTGMQESFIGWCIECKKGSALGSVPPKKQYRNLFVFFKKIGNSTRAIAVKEQEHEFIEIILSGHLLYDLKREELGYKKSSYYSS